MKKARRFIALVMAALMILNGSGTQVLAEVAAEKGVEFVRKTSAAEFVVYSEPMEENNGPESVVEFKEEENEDEGLIINDEVSDEPEIPESKTTDSEVEEEAEDAFPDPFNFDGLSLSGEAGEADYVLYCNNQSTAGSGVSVTYNEEITFKILPEENIENEKYYYKKWTPEEPDPEVSWTEFDESGICKLAADKYYLAFYLEDNTVQPVFHHMDASGKWILNVGLYDLLAPAVAGWSAANAVWEKSGSDEADVGKYELQLYYGTEKAGAKVEVPVSEGTEQYIYDFSGQIKSKASFGLYHYTVKAIASDSTRCKDSAEKISTNYNYAKLTLKKGLNDGVESVSPSELDLGSEGEGDIEATIKPDYIFTGWTCTPASSSIFFDPEEPITKVRLEDGYENSSEIELTANVMKLNDIASYSDVYDTEDHKLTAGFTGSAGIYDVSWAWYKDGSDTPCASGDTLTVKNVADSGIYKAELTLSKEGYPSVTASVDDIEVHITKAALKVKAADVSADYGSEPAYAAKYYRKDNAAEVTDPEISTGAVSYTTNYNANDPAGIYNINTVVTGMGSANYTYEPHATAGKLTVNRKTLYAEDFTVSIAEKTYDAKTDASVASLTAELEESDKPYLSQIIATASFVNKDAGTDKAVKVSLALDESSGNTRLYDRYVLNNGLELSATGTVNKVNITVTANPNQGKIYGGEDPSTLLYTVTAGTMVGTETLSGALSREAGENVGTYEILQNTLGDKNYNITYVSSLFTITKSPGNNVVVKDAKSKIYDQKKPDAPVYETNGDYTGTVENGKITFHYYTKDGNDYIPVTPSDAGTYYVQVVAAADSNYETASSSCAPLTISPIEVTVTPDPGQSKYYAESDPVLRYSVSPALLSGDSFTGGLSRVSGTAVGKYDITIGSLSNRNYHVTLAPEKFEIKKAVLATPTVAVASSSSYYSGKAVGIEVSAVPDGAAAPEVHFGVRKDGATITDTRVQPTDAGTYEVWVIVPGNARYEEAASDREHPVIFEIKKRPVTIVSGTSEWSYDGKDHYDHSYSCAFTGDVSMDAFPDSEGIKSITLDASVRNYTSAPVPNEFELTDITFKDGTNPDNYQFELVSGTLQVHKAGISVPKNLAWSSNAAGKSTWTAVANPVEGAVIVYEVKLKNKGVTIATESTVNTYFDFTEMIRSNVEYSSGEDLQGEFSFSVNAGIDGDSSVVRSGEVSNSDRIYPVVAVFGLGRGVSATVGTKPITAANNYYIFLSGEITNVDSQVSLGHTASAQTWQLTGGTQCFTFADSTQQSTTVTVANVSKPTVGGIYIASDDDKPAFFNYEGENTDDLQSIKLNIHVANKINKLKAWAVTTSSSAPAEADPAWNIITDDEEKKELSISVSKPIAEVASESVYYLYVMDGFDMVYHADEPVHVYRIAFEKGDNLATDSMDPGIKVQGKAAKLPKNNFKLTGKAFQNWDDGNGKSYNDEGYYKANSPATLTAQWADAKYQYTVKYFFEKLDNTFEEDESARKELEGRYKEKIHNNDENLQLGRDGFELTTNGEPTEITLDGDGKVLNIYYARKTYHIYYFVTGGRTPVTYSDAYRYGENITVKPKLDTLPEYEGYAFVGWTWQGGEGAPTTMPAQDVYVSGQLVGQDTTYIVKAYREESNGNYKYYGEDTFPGKTGEEFQISSALYPKGVTGGAYYGYIVSEEGIDGPTEKSQVEARIATGSGTAYISGRTASPTDVSLYYKLNSYGITLNVYRSDADDLTTPVYTKTFSGIQAGTAITPSDYDEYMMSEWTKDYPKYRVSDIIIWDNGSRPTTMPGQNVRITRYITPIDTDVPYVVDTYFMNADGNYYSSPSKTQTFYAKAEQTLKGIPATTVRLATTSGQPKENDTCYLNINSTEVTRLYGTDVTKYQWDIDNEYAVSEISRSAGTGFSNHLKIYYKNKDVTATVTYYYDNGDGNGYRSFKSESYTGPWGITRVSPSVATKYFEGNTRTTPGVGYDFLNNDYVIYYDYGSTWSGAWYVLVDSVEKLTEMRDSGKTTTSYWDARLGLDGLTVNIYYKRVPEKNYIAVPLYYVSNLKYATESETALKTTVSGNEYFIRYCDYAYAYNTTYASSSVVGYPGLGAIQGTYSYNGLRDGFSLITVNGKQYPCKGDTIYVTASSSNAPVLYEDNYAGFTYPSDGPGMEVLNQKISNYQTEHGNEEGSEYDERAEFASIYTHGFSYRPVNTSKKAVFTIGYYGYSTFYHLIDGIKCEGHYFRNYTQVSAEKTITCSKHDFSKGAYTAKWYYNPELTNPVTEGSKTVEHHNDFYLYGKYVYAVKDGTDTAYYYVQAPEVNGYIKDISVLSPSSVATQSVKVLDGGGDKITKTVTERTYYYIGTDGYPYLAMKERTHPAVAFSDAGFDWDSADTSPKHFQGKDFDATGYYFSSTNTGNVVAGIPMAEPLNLIRHYHTNSWFLHWDIVSDTGDITQTKKYKAYSSIVKVNAPSKLGYTFTGWKITKTKDGTEVTPEKYTLDPVTKQASFHMPAYELTMTSLWEPAEFDQTITYHYQNEDLIYDDNEAVGNKFERRAELTSEATFSVAQHHIPPTPSDYFEFDTVIVTYAEKDENVKNLPADGTAEVKVGMTIDYYYKRKDKVITVDLAQEGYIIGQANLYGDGKYHYGRLLTVTAGFNTTGYTFKGWYTATGSDAVPVSTASAYTFRTGLADWWPGDEAQATLIAVFEPVQPDIPVITLSTEKPNYVFGYEDSAENTVISTYTYTTAETNSYISAYRWFKKTGNGAYQEMEGENSPTLHLRTGMSAGTYTFKVEATSKLEVNGCTRTVWSENELTVTVAKAPMKVSGYGYTGVYDALPHSPAVVVDVPGVESLYTVYYSTDSTAEKNYTTQCPSQTDVGTMKVYWYVKANGSSPDYLDFSSAASPKSVEVKITPALAEIVATSSTLTKVYDHGTDVVYPAGHDINDYLSVAKVLGTDELTVSVDSAQYDSKDVATASQITYTGLKLVGEKSGNYTLGTQNKIHIAGKITPYPITNGWAKTEGGSAVTGAIEYDYDGNEHVPALVFPALYAGSQAVVSGAQINAGTYQADATVQSVSYQGTDDAVSNYTFASLQKDYTILGNRKMQQSAKGFSGLYDSLYHRITVTVAEPAREADVTVYYSTVGELTSSNYTTGVTENPGFRDVEMDGTAVKTHRVWYYIKDNSGNYVDAAGSSSVTLTSVPVSVSGLKGVDKLYDGNTDADLNYTTEEVANIIPGEDIRLDRAAVTAAFASANVGTWDVAISYATESSYGRIFEVKKKGSDSYEHTDNYIFVASESQAKTSASITTASFVATISDKNLGTYDRTDKSYTVDPVCTPVPKTEVSYTYSLDGINYSASLPVLRKAGTHTVYFKAAAENYGTCSGSFKATIEPKKITAKWENATSSVYDGSAHGIKAGLNSVEPGDVVIPSVTGTTEAVNCGKYIATISDIGGTDASNYTVKYENSNVPLTCDWEITPKAVTDQNISVADISAKTYKGSAWTPEPVVTDVNLDKVLKKGTDFDYEYPQAGNIEATASAWVKVNFKNNYSGSVTKLFTINPKTVTVIWTDPGSLVYSGTAKTVTVALDGVVGTDDVGFDLTAASIIHATASDTYHAQVEKLTGAKKDNYIATASEHEWTITKRPVKVTWKDENNQAVSGTISYVYTNTAHSVIPVLDILAADQAKVTYETEGLTATDSNAYTAKVTRIKAATAGDKTWENYSFSESSKNWKITQADIHVQNIHANDKYYDGTTAASFNYSTGSEPYLKAEDLKPGDEPATGRVVLNTAGGSAVFNNASCGVRNVTVTGYSLTGDASGNYKIVYPVVTASIYKSSLDISGIEAVSRDYNGNTDAEIRLQNVKITGLMPGDAGKVAVSKAGVTASFASKNVGSNQTVTFGGQPFSLTGEKAGNYSIGTCQETATASITEKEVTIQWSGAQTQTYDNTPKFVSASIAGGVVSGENIGLAVIDYSKTEGGTYTAKVASLTAEGGALTANYKLPSNTDYQWTIAPAQLAVTTPQWGTTAGENGVVSFSEVQGIGAVSVDKYVLKLMKKNGGNYEEVQRVTLSSAERSTDAFVNRIHYEQGTYKVELQAIASLDNNADNRNVTDSQIAETPALHTAIVTFAYAEDEVTKAALGTDSTVRNLRIGPMATRSDYCALSITEGDDAVSLAATLRNATGYDAEIKVTSYGVPVNVVDITELKTEPYSNMAITTANAKLGQLTDKQAEDGIVLLVSYTARAAQVDCGIKAMLNGVEFATADQLTYGYLQGPELSLTYTPHGDQVQYDISNYAWYYQEGFSGAKFVTSSDKMTFPTGKDAGDIYLVYCGFTATRKDNGMSTTVKWQKNSRNFTIGRASLSGINVYMAGISGGNTWKYGEQDASAKLDVTSNPGGAAVHYFYTTGSDADRVWYPMLDGQDFPEDVGTYYFKAEIEASGNYDAYTTDNSCILTVTKNKLDTPENIRVEIGKGTGPSATPSMMVKWASVSEIGAVTVTYNLKVYAGSKSNPGTLLGEYLGLETTQQDIFGIIKDHDGKYYLDVVAVSDLSENCDNSDPGILQLPKTTRIIQTGNHATESEWVYDGKATVLEVQGADPTKENYQWYLDGEAIDVASASTWSVKDVQKSGWYCCEVSNKTGEKEEKISNFIHLDISKVGVEIKGIRAADKIYDRTADAVIVGSGTIEPLYDAGELFINADHAAATFSDKDVDVNKTVTFGGYIIYGDEADNYYLTAQPAPVKATISQLDTLITGLSAEDKTYDGTAVATPDGAAVVSALIAGDTVNVSVGTASFADKNAGEGKTVTFAGYSLTGADAANYNLTAQPASVTASIAKRPITVKGIKADDKVYDGNATASEATASVVVLEGNLDGDNLQLVHGSLTFNNKTASKGKSVTAAGYSLTGSERKNYVLSAQPVIPNAEISKKPASMTGLSAEDKIYDRTTAADPTGSATLTGIVEGDQVALDTGKANFADKNIGTDKTVTFTGYKLSGTDASNYEFTQHVPVKATISQLDTLITGLSAEDKTYDGTAVATPDGAAVVSALIAGDTVNVSAGTASFADKNAGEGKTVTFAGYSLTGADAANYNLTAQPASVTASIAKKKVTIVGVTAQDKEYDGNKTAVAVNTASTVEGKISGDTLTIVYGTAEFDQADPGSNIPVHFHNYAIAGDTHNYELKEQPADAHAAIFTRNRVKHHKANLYETGYVFEEEEPLVCTVSQMTDAKAKTYPGFKTKLPIGQKMVVQDVNTVVDIYYDREHYTVTFAATPSDVILSFNEKEVVYGQTFGEGTPSNLPTAEKTGYTFHGWYTEEIGGVQILPGTRVATDSERTLYPHFTPNSYKIRFNGNGETAGTMEDQDMVYDVPAALKKNGYVRKGYTFRGWASASVASRSDYANEETVVNLTAQADGVYDLYAYWTINSYNVSFDLNGGSGEKPQDQMVVFGQKVKKPQDPVRSGFRFTGWLYGERTWNFDTDVVEQGMTLKAGWQSTASNQPTIGGPGTVGIANVYPSPIGNPITTFGDWELIDPSKRVWMLNVGNGKYASGGWVYVKNPYTKNGNDYAWFFFDENGIMQYGWIRTQNPYAWYYANSISDTDLGMLVKGWYTDTQDGNVYYLDPIDGKMHTGWTTVNGKQYYFETVGIRENTAWYQDIIDPRTGLKGWFYRKVEGKPLGSMYRNEMTPDGHFVDENGVKVR